MRDIFPIDRLGQVRLDQTRDPVEPLQIVLINIRAPRAGHDIAQKFLETADFQ